MTRITIDGLPGAGKSSLAAELALLYPSFDFVVVDTGLIYRVLALVLAASGADITYAAAVRQALHGWQDRVHWSLWHPARESVVPPVLWEADDVTSRLWNPEVEKHLRVVDRIPNIREEIRQYYRGMIGHQNAIVTGRNEGVLLPEADLRVVLWASKEVRAARRRQQFAGTPERSIAVKDPSDMDEATLLALARAPNALFIDSSTLSPREVLVRCAGQLAQRLHESRLTAPRRSTGQPSPERERLQQFVDDFIVANTDDGVPRVVVGPGDDCAVIEVNSHRSLVVGTDYVRGPMFYLAMEGYLDLYELGYYLVMANASDLAAMGADPVAFFSVVRYPSTMDDKDYQAIQHGIKDACRDCGLLLAGGDTGSAERVILSGAAIGSCKSEHVLLRSGARVGDVLCIIGDIGRAGSAIAYYSGNPRYELSMSDQQALLYAWRHPQARIREGRLLAAHGATSGQDGSDGAHATVQELSEMSGVGFVVREEALVIPAEVVRVADTLGRDPMELALGASSDFTLVFTVPLAELPKVRAAFKLAGLSFVEIGEATDLRVDPRTMTASCVLQGRDGTLRELPGSPWDHRNNAIIKAQRPGDVIQPGLADIGALRALAAGTRKGYARQLLGASRTSRYHTVLAAMSLMGSTVVDTLHASMIAADDPAVEQLGRAFIQSHIWRWMNAPERVALSDGSKPSDMAGACAAAVVALIEFRGTYGVNSPASSATVRSFIRGMEKETAESFLGELVNFAPQVVRLIVRRPPGSLDEIGEAHAALSSLATRVAGHQALPAAHAIAHALRHEALLMKHRSGWLTAVQGPGLGAGAELARLLAEMPPSGRKAVGDGLGHAHFPMVPATAAGLAACFSHVGDALRWPALGLGSGRSDLHEGLVGFLTFALTDHRGIVGDVQVDRNVLRNLMNGSLSQSATVALKQVLLIGVALKWTPAIRSYERQWPMDFVLLTDGVPPGKPSAVTRFPNVRRPADNSPGLNVALDWAGYDDRIDPDRGSPWVNAVMAVAMGLVIERVPSWWELLDGGDHPQRDTSWPGTVDNRWERIDGGRSWDDGSSVKAFLQLRWPASAPARPLPAALANGLIEHVRRVGGGDLGVAVLTLTDRVEAVMGPGGYPLRAELWLRVAAGIAEAVSGIALGERPAIDGVQPGLVALALGKDPNLRRHTAVAVQQLLMATFRQVPEGATAGETEDFTGRVIAALRSIDQRLDAAGLARAERGDMLWPSLTWLQPALTAVFQAIEQGSQSGAMDPKFAVQLLTLGRTSPGPVVDALLEGRTPAAACAMLERLLDEGYRSNAEAGLAPLEGGLHLLRSLAGSHGATPEVVASYARVRALNQPGVPDRALQLESLAGQNAYATGLKMGHRLFAEFSGTAESLGLCLQRSESAVDWRGLGSRKQTRDLLRGMSDALRRELRRHRSDNDFGSLGEANLRSLFDDHLSHDLTILARQVWILVDACDGPTRRHPGRRQPLPEDVGALVVKAAVRQATIGRVDAWWDALVSDSGLHDLDLFDRMWEAVPEEYVMESIAPLGGALIERTMVDTGNSQASILALRQRFDSMFGGGLLIASEWMVRAAAHQIAASLGLLAISSGHGDPTQLAALALTLSKDEDMRKLVGHEIANAAEREFGGTPVGESAVHEVTRIAAIESALEGAGMPRALRAEVLSPGLHRLRVFLDGGFPIRTRGGTIEFDPLIAGPILQSAGTCPHLLAPTVIAWTEGDPDQSTALEAVLEALLMAGAAGTAGPRTAALGVSRLITAITEIQGLRSWGLNDLYTRAVAQAGAPEPSKTMQAASGTGRSNGGAASPHFVV